MVNKSKKHGDPKSSRAGPTSLLPKVMHYLSNLEGEQKHQGEFKQFNNIGVNFIVAKKYYHGRAVLKLRVLPPHQLLSTISERVRLKAHMTCVTERHAYLCLEFK